VEEARPAFVGARLITEEELANTLFEMQPAADTPGGREVRRDKKKYGLL
jgi:hypothetical protein